MLVRASQVIDEAVDDIPGVARGNYIGVSAIYVLILDLKKFTFLGNGGHYAIDYPAVPGKAAWLA